MSNRDYLLIKRFCIGLSAVVVVSLAGCIQPQQIDLIEREQRRLRRDIGVVQSDIEGVRANLADTRANTQQMQREVSAVKERLDETRVKVGRELGQTSREGDQRVKNLESKLAKLEDELKIQGELLKSQGELLNKREEELKQLRETAQAAAQREPATPGDGVAEGAAAESDAVKKDYETGWRAVEKKDYRVAISRFKDFLKKHPKSKLAGNAQYWIGECHYALREFDQAILEFDTVRRKYPQGEKVSAALLKQGYAFAELGEKVNARIILQEVVEKYPQSPEAARAKQKLKSIES
ncbi:MAG: tol-pal system protein YbgF [Candidatus Binatia bacterium]